MLRTRLLALLVPTLIAACVAGPTPEAQRRAPASDELPTVRTLPAPQVTRTSRSNADLARDFLELSFQMESGRSVPVLSRFEGPVTIALQGKVPATVAPDLARLVSRLRSEAGIDIGMAGSGQRANITVEFLSRATLQGLVPQAACFVVPNIDSWSAFRRARNSARIDWTLLTSRTQVAVFIPNDTSPQEMRDCLHEEIGQALGPLNDLYRLPDSVFNDDNFNTVLTGFDMLILRAFYSPDLHSGMTAPEVAAVLPGLLARINPQGAGGAGPVPGPTPRVWIEAVETALGSGSSGSVRRDAARRAVSIAESQGWSDGRLAFSLFALGRLSLAEDADVAVRAFARAGQVYRSMPATGVHLAHVDMQLAAFALSAGRPDDALLLTNRSLLPVAGAENAALLASLLMIKSEALRQLGRASESRAVWLDSIGWARYGFGPESEVRDRQSEIASLAPERG